MSGWECRVRILAFSPADGTLALGCADGMVRLREPRKLDPDPRLARPCAGDHRDVLRHARQRPATAGRDGTARVWDLATGAAELLLCRSQERWAAVPPTVPSANTAMPPGLSGLRLGLSRQPPIRHAVTQ